MITTVGQFGSKHTRGESTQKMDLCEITGSPGIEPGTISHRSESHFNFFQWIYCLISELLISNLWNKDGQLSPMFSTKPNVNKELMVFGNGCRPSIQTSREMSQAAGTIATGPSPCIRLFNTMVLVSKSLYGISVPIQECSKSFPTCGIHRTSSRLLMGST